jgi:nitrogen fixation protein FixH
MMQRDDHSLNGAVASARPLTGRMVLICLVSFFAVVASVNAIMIRAAVTTFGGVETESSYKAGLAFAREIAASEAQQARGWKVSAMIVPDGRDGRRVEVIARDGADRPIPGLVATVWLAHPTDRRSDQSITMTEDWSGRFSGTAPTVAGQWDLVIDLARDGERMFRSKSRMILR